MKKGKIYIGTSGWSNSYWKGRLYPPESKSKEFLKYYTKTFNASEVNTTFYHIPKLSTVEGWISSVPKGFKFCVKMSKYITHLKRLKEPEQPIERFFGGIEPLQKYVGPILIQLPPSLKFNFETAEHFFDTLKKDYSKYSFVLEARHESWYESEALSLLADNNIAIVIAESGDRYPTVEIISTNTVYLRFHGPEKLFDSPHSDEMLEAYARKILIWQKEGRTVWVFFNNTMHEHALDNAEKLKEYLQIE